MIPFLFTKKFKKFKIKASQLPVFVMKQRQKRRNQNISVWKRLIINLTVGRRKGCQKPSATFDKAAADIAARMS